jgi:hypothetical protein
MKFYIPFILHKKKIVQKYKSYTPTSRVRALFFWRCLYQESDHQRIHHEMYFWEHHRGRIRVRNQVFLGTLSVFTNDLRQGRMKACVYYCDSTNQKQVSCGADLASVFHLSSFSSYCICYVAYFLHLLIILCSYLHSFFITASLKLCLIQQMREKIFLLWSLNLKEGKITINCRLWSSYKT